MKINSVPLLVVFCFVLTAIAPAQPVLESTNQAYSFVLVTNPPTEASAYWSMQFTNLPPFPCNPWPALPLFQWQADGSANNDGQYYVDDLEVDYATNDWRIWGPVSTAGSNHQHSHAEMDEDGPPAPGGGETNADGGAPPVFTNTFSPPAFIPDTAYSAYNEFYLGITNNPTNCHVSIYNTLSNLTYVIQTNHNLANNAGWATWQVLRATNTVTPAPPLSVVSNGALCFRALLVWSTCTNYNPAIPDWWAELYYQSTECINPEANPSGDGIDNWDKYVLGLNPNTAYASQMIFLPPGGNYVATPFVAIISLAGTTITYTTDGSTPSASHGTAVSSGVLLTNLPSTNFTLKAWTTGLTPNLPYSDVYAIIPATPTFTLPEGTYTQGTTLQISCATPNAIVRYTTNGIDPATNSLQIRSTNVLTLTTNVTIKAAAWLGTNVSPVGCEAFLVTIPPTNSPPPPANDNFSNAIVISGSSGSVAGTTVSSTLEAFEVNNYSEFWIANDNNNSVWYQWTAPSNGSVFFYYGQDYPSFYYFPTGVSHNPTNLVAATSSQSGSEYFAILTATQSVTYYVSVSDYEPSGPFTLQWAYVTAGDSPPVFSPPAGNYYAGQAVTISCADPEAVIHYTTDSVNPTTNDPAIPSGSSVTFYQTTTLKAATWRTGLDESPVTTALYTMQAATTNAELAGPPTLSPVNVIFTNSMTVTLTCTNAGGIIHYTLNGSNPTTASPSVTSGGTVSLTNSSIISALTWAGNLNLSPITTAQYAKWGVDTAGDGIPDSGKLLIGANILLNDANDVNPNPFAHGLDNMQVYENPSVLLADNYSTENDGIPDWWLVQNGYSVTTSASALGANGQTLLVDYVGGYSPNNPNSQPGQLPPIDFQMVYGPSNYMVMVLNTVRPDIASYFLFCTQTDPNSESYNQTFREDFPANTSMDQPSNGLGRYFQMTNQLTPGDWLFTMQARNTNTLWSETSSNTFATYFEQYGAPERPQWGRSVGVSVPVVGYMNKTALDWPILTQRLRAESDVWQDSDDLFYESLALFNVNVPDAVTTETSWGTLTFEFDTNSDDDYGLDYYPTGYASYFNSICATPNVSTSCDSYYSGLSGADAYGFPNTELEPLQIQWRPIPPYDTSYTPYFAMPDETFNPAGLEYLSLEYEIGGTSHTLLRGQSNAVSDIDFSFEVALDPETNTFQATNYYFDGRQYPVWSLGYYYRSYPPVPSLGPVIADGWGLFDGETFLPVSTTNPVIVAQVGRPVTLQGWAQVVPIRPGGQSLTNQTYWIDQDFGQAYLCDPATGDVPRTDQPNVNGKMKINTNAAVTTGILSPSLDITNTTDIYNGNVGLRGANFTPTQAGKIIVTTLPDANGNYGEVTIYVIDMQVDANHDGVMDNRDLTSVDNPMQFWVNNDVDRWHSIDYGTDSEQDDLLVNDSSQPFWAQVPDCQYRNGVGNYAIPCTRDLEDYARLWIPGLTNLLEQLPTNYSVSLQWRNNTGAGIRIFGAADSDGGTNYLFNGTTASNQVDEGWYPCFGYVTNQPLAANMAGWESLNGYAPSDHFIFCGTSIGNDELVLQVKNPWGGVAGEASVFLNLKDIKQMYERWSVGENPASAPNDIATNCGDGGVASFQYPYDSQTDINTPYILHVHGSNMETWDKDRYAETMYKRLYWQGYQGRFGSFRWPTASGYSLAFSPPAQAFFGEIEDSAWLSAIGLKNLLTRLDILYPGQVQLSAHSMGNITAGEALRQATTTLVQTYTAFQGSVPAHTYDPDAPTLTLSPDAGEPNVYAHYWNATNAQYFADAIGAARYVNFFNTNDFVLNHWLAYQPDKPVSYFDYGYSSSQYYQIVIGGYDYLYFPTNTYQIFAFCQQAQCNCIGEQANLGGVFLGNQVELDRPPYNYQDTHKYHSGEFRSDNMSRAVFWNQLLLEMGLKK